METGWGTNEYGLFDRDGRVRNCVRTNFNGVERDKNGMELVKNGFELGKDGIELVKNGLETRWTATFNIARTNFCPDENER